MFVRRTETRRDVHLEGDRLVDLLQQAVVEIHTQAADDWEAKDIFAGSGYQPTAEERATGAETRPASLSIHFEEAR